MRRLAILALIGALGACGASEPSKRGAGYADTRQQPSNTAPGIHISGHANIGVVRQF